MAMMPLRTVLRAESPKQGAAVIPWALPMTLASLRSPSSWLLLLTLMFAGEARADVVGPPARDCPSNSVGDVCHGGEFCRPVPCETDGDCGLGETCQDAKACIGGISCSGLTGGDPPVPTFEGPCKAGDVCDGEATCQPFKLCVDTGSSTGTASSGPGGTGDNTGGGDTGAPTSGGSAGSSGGSGGSEGSTSGGDGGTKGCACAVGGGAGEVGLVGVVLVGVWRRRRGRIGGR